MTCKDVSKSYILNNIMIQIIEKNLSVFKGSLDISVFEMSLVEKKITKGIGLCWIPQILTRLFVHF